MFRFFAIILCFIIWANPLMAQKKGYEIRVKLTNYANDTLLLGNHYGDKQYLKDTTLIRKDGYFVFHRDTALECGVYLIITLPEKQYFEILVTDIDQNYTIETDVKDPYRKGTVKGSDDNSIFFKYSAYIRDMRDVVDSLRNEKDKALDDKVKEKFQSKMEDVDKEVKKYQQNIVEKYPSMLSARLIKASFEVDIPKFEGEQKDVDLKRYLYYKAHYFDYFDFNDPCMVRSPILAQKMDYYVNKLTVQHPDSVCVSVDTILSRVKNNEEAYKYCLVYLLNFYAKGQYVGQDGVYVHIAKNYICNGKAPFLDKDNHDKICDDASKLEPLLIGKIAPDIRMFKQDSTPISLHQIKSKYTVLFMWDPDCGHCKQTMPFVKDFYDKFKDRGVEVFAVCIKGPSEIKKCWDTIEERGIVKWLNVVDPYQTSRYQQLYNAKTWPQLYILDENKVIISKRIGGEKLEEVMDQIIKADQEKLKNK